MSYILDALRRSEQERHQENIRNLTGQDSLIHVNKHAPQAWPYILITVLIINAGIFLWMHLDKQEKETIAKLELPNAVSTPSDSYIASEEKDIVHSTNSEVSQNTRSSSLLDPALSESQSNGSKEAEGSTQSKSIGTVVEPKPTQGVNTPSGEKRAEIYIDGGLLIQPKGSTRQVMPTPLPDYSAVSLNTYNQHKSGSETYGDVAYLVDQDLAFQKQIPSLTFNSHIYSEIPGARRVMINNIYLREGQVFSGLEVVHIGERDIVFSKNGTLFKRPVMRDW